MTHAAQILLISGTLLFFIFLYLLWWWGFFFKPYFPRQESQFTTIQGIKHHYTVNGEGPAILLVHGIGANIYCWRKLIPLLSQKYKVWAVDLKGFGLSDKPLNAPYDLKTQSQMILEFIKKEILDSTHAQCALIGSSMGGAICLEAALTSPSLISALILLAPAYDSSIIIYDPRIFRKFLKLFIGFANPWIVARILKYIYGPKSTFSKEDIHNYLRPYLKDKQSLFSLIDSFACLTDDTLKSRIKNIKLPTVALWGKQDRLVNFSLALNLQKIISHAQIYIHETAGHHIQEEDPTWVIAKISESEVLKTDKNLNKVP